MPFIFSLIGIPRFRRMDLDQDGFADVVLCDATMNQVSWIRQEADGSFTEKFLGDTILAPAHVTPSDIDLDGDIDLLVAKMGAILPNNDKIGSVIVLENDGQQEFTTRILLDGIARVTDIEPGDFDGDGDIDLVVGQFGYDDGKIRWMENLGGWNFESHDLLELSGTIHTPVGDLDGDGDLDIAAVVSQEWEEIYVFENDGKGMFDRHLVYGATNDDFGSSGISLADLDLDGDLDVLYSNGDAFDYIPPGPRPWHGVQWLENDGDLGFTYHRIGDFPGAYFANAVDGDLDGDVDVFVVSAFNDWDSPEAASLAWFENDGAMGFTRRILATEPTHLLALASADMDGDGLVDLVTGAMHVSPPYDRMSRVTLWRNTWRDP
ncbi:MAG TPA: VCBS repeat-containing protein [Acidobacteria bacterium]|nr:VCBS repeat-containing protein [Acidobacteriota bacterium]